MDIGQKWEENFGKFFGWTILLLNFKDLWRATAQNEPKTIFGSIYRVGVALQAWIYTRLIALWSSSKESDFYCTSVHDVDKSGEVLKIKQLEEFSVAND